MARKAKPKAATAVTPTPAVTQAQAEENLRQGNECYALHIGVPRMFARERDFASVTLAQIEKSKRPELTKRAVIAAANSLLFHLEALIGNTRAVFDKNYKDPRMDTGAVFNLLPRPALPADEADNGKGGAA